MCLARIGIRSTTQWLGLMLLAHGIGCNRPAANPATAPAANPERPTAASADGGAERALSSPEDPRSVASRASSEPSVGPAEPISSADPASNDARRNGAGEEGESLQSVADIAQRANSAVVYLVAMDALGEEQASGTGFLVNDSGMVATNFHVLDGAVTAFAQFKDGTKVDVQGFRVASPDRDLALLQLENLPEETQPFALEDPGELDQGASLVAIGHPSGFQFTVTTGIVSALRTTKELPDEYRTFLNAPDDQWWIQTTAAISGGNSGGPLLDEQGRVVGVNTWIARGQNLGFAVHVRHLIELMQEGSDQVSPLPFPGLGLITDRRVASVYAGYPNETEVFYEKLRSASSEREQERLVVESHPAGEYAQRLLALAKEEPSSKRAVEALAMTVGILEAETFEDENGQEKEVSLINEKTRKIVDEAIDLAETHLTTHADIGEFCWQLLGWGFPTADTFLNKVLRENPVRDNRGIAALALADNLRRVAENTDSLELTPDTVSPEVGELLRVVMKDYADVRIRGRRLEDIAKPWYMDRHVLAIGRRAPGLAGKGFDDQPLSLEAFRGKVVLVDFWVDWCPFCREMYPLQKGLLEQYPDDFVVLGVNGDQRNRAERVLESGQVTWQSIFDGPDGPVSEEWNVTSYPTTFLVDRTGVIRFRDLRGPALRQAVQQLVGEERFRDARVLIARDDPWHFLADASQLPGDWVASTAWRVWPEGRGPFGYGTGDENTSLEMPPLATDRGPTACFAREFEVADPKAIRDLVLAVWFDDGIVMHLNGREILRKLVAIEAKPSEAALDRRPSNGRDPSYRVLDPSWLRPGKNLLTAQVHQAEGWNADARFAARLIANGVDELVRQCLEGEEELSPLAFGTLADLGPAALPAKDRLDKLVRSPKETVGLSAYAALLAMVGTDEVEKLPKPAPKSFASLSLWPKLASQYNNLAWRFAMASNRSLEDYRYAHRMALLGLLLSGKQDYVKNTLGLTHLRLEEFEFAQQALSESYKGQGKNPSDLAVMGLLMAKQGKTQKARVALDAAQKMLDGDPEKWKGETEDVRRLLDEIQAILGDVSETPPGPGSKTQRPAST